MSYTEYSCSRLTFKACIIESLKENDVFCIKTPVGSFQMTKGDFYKSFPNVIQTKSYREQGVYSYTKTPQKANKYLFELIGGIKIRLKISIFYGEKVVHLADF